MAIYIYWFLLALALLGVEMATGTFYLLVLSIAAAVGGSAALLGMGFTVQLGFSALAGIAGILLLRRWKGGRNADADSQNLDVGQTVRVLNWREDGTARVFFRGAEWDAELDAADAPREGTLYIKAMRGSVLVLTHQRPA